jgi:hypothetical protein
MDSTKIPEQKRLTYNQKESDSTDKNKTRTRLQIDEQKMRRWLLARQESQYFANEVQHPHIRDQHR